MFFPIRGWLEQGKTEKQAIAEPKQAHHLHRPSEIQTLIESAQRDDKSIEKGQKESPATARQAGGTPLICSLGHKEMATRVNVEKHEGSFTHPDRQLQFEVIQSQTIGMHRQTGRGGAVLRRSSRTCNYVPYYRVKGESADEFHYFTSISTRQALAPHLRGSHGPHRSFAVGTGRCARPCVDCG